MYTTLLWLILFGLYYSFWQIHMIYLPIIFRVTSLVLLGQYIYDFPSAGDVTLKHVWLHQPHMFLNVQLILSQQYFRQWLGTMQVTSQYLNHVEQDLKCHFALLDHIGIGSFHISQQNNSHGSEEFKEIK